MATTDSSYLVLDMENDLVHENGVNGKGPYGQQVRARQILANTRRALDKARAEMKTGAWLASLEFEAAGWMPQAVHRCPDGRPLWLYRLPLRASSSAGAGR